MKWVKAAFVLLLYMPLTQMFYLLCIVSKYGLDKKHWRKGCYSSMVNISDEALVMQVVMYYFPRWKNQQIVEEDDGECSEIRGGKRICGPKRGERNTGSTTVKTFYEYLKKFKNTRDSEYKGVWDKKLQDVANAQHRLELCEKERLLGDEMGDESTDNINTNFDLDFCDGCFDGDIGNDDGQETQTVVTEL